MKVCCPFCKPTANALRGDGCCFCDYEGVIPEKENARLLDSQAPNDEPYPFFSNHDLKEGRKIIKDRSTETT